MASEDWREDERKKASVFNAVVRDAVALLPGKWEIEESEDPENCIFVNEIRDDEDSMSLIFSRTLYSEKASVSLRLPRDKAARRTLKCYGLINWTDNEPRLNFSISVDHKKTSASINRRLIVPCRGQFKKIREIINNESESFKIDIEISKEIQGAISGKLAGGVNQLDPILVHSVHVGFEVFNGRIALKAYDLSKEKAMAIARILSDGTR